MPGQLKDLHYIVLCCLEDGEEQALKDIALEMKCSSSKIVAYVPALFYSHKVIDARMSSDSAALAIGVNTLIKINDKGRAILAEYKNNR